MERSYLAAAPASRARDVVMLFVVTLAIITYVDRVCISQASNDIMRDLGLSKKEMGMVFSAFTVAYALFEIPGGWLGDKYGARSVLMRVVVVWSLFTAATGRAWNLASMLVCRFIFGMGEAGCFPNLTKIFTTWFPANERVRAQGILWLSARWGGAFTPALVVWVLGYMSWRNAFVLFGALGIVWAVVFYRWFRDNPRNHPSVNAGELALLAGAEHNAAGHGDVPWGRFLRSRTVWMLWLAYFCSAYSWYFYITWLPKYLEEARGLALGKSAVLAGLPLFFGGIGCVVSGTLAARMALWFASTARARRFMAMVGLFSAGCLLLVSTRVQSPVLAMVAMGLSSFSQDLSMPSAWGACMDVGGRYAGSLSGSMNMMGNFGGAVGPLVVAWILEMNATKDNWTPTFWVAGAAYFVAGFAWLLIDPVTPLDREDTPGPQRT
jgi:MFS family permease